MHRKIQYFLSIFLVMVNGAVFSAESMDCSIVVVGGGVSGLYMAYELSKQSNVGTICLLEKNSYLGGRVFDVALDKNRPDLVYGLGALRVLEGQEEIFALAKELDITLVKAPYQSDLINTRGVFAFSSDDINRLVFPSLSDDLIDGSGYGTETKLISRLYEHHHLASKYFDIRSFIRDVLSPEGLWFLHDVIRLRAEFIRSVDIRAFFSYYQEETRQGVDPFYPIGGMSQFVTKMAARANSNGVRIFVDEPVIKIEKQQNSQQYHLTTKKYVVQAHHVVLAVASENLKYIEGSVIKSIIDSPQYQELMPIEVVVVNQKWPSSWWIDSGYNNKVINRAWTTEHCLNFIEIPQNEYAAQQKVTRSVYSDDPNCNEFWKNLFDRGGTPAVEEEVYRGLKHLFPYADIPKPEHTVMKVWPSAWNWLRGGSPYTVDDIVAWAATPLVGEEISLVGESYFIKRAGWIDAAVRSAQNVLRQRFNNQ